MIAKYILYYCYGGKNKLNDNGKMTPIAYDGKTVSESVLQVVNNGEVRAVLDIDAVEQAAFDELDQENLESIVSNYT